MYEIATWFTECPYFNLIAGICSIISTVAIIKFVCRRKTKPITSTDTAAKIVNSLIEMAEKYTDFWLSFGKDDLDKFPDLEGQRIDFSHSFFIMIDHSTDLPVFALIKTSKDIRLYGCLDKIKSSYRLLTTSSDTPALEKLLDLASAVQDLSNDEFSKQILSKLKSI